LALGVAPLLPFSLEEIERSIPERFARVAAARSSAPAIAVGSNRITYAELAQRATALAAAIVRHASGSDAPVAVMLHDPISLATAILATWSAGRICVPLDAALPQPRLEVILRDADAGVVITDRASSISLPHAPRAPRLHVDELGGRTDERLIWPTVHGEDSACILYTSGSTGEPKGVLRSHRSVLHRARCSVLSLAIEAHDRVSALHSPASAGGMRDLMAALLGGAALLPFDLRQAGLADLARWIDREEISVLCTVVSTLRHILASLDPDIRFRSLRVVRLGSEPLYRRDVDRLREHVRPDCVLVTGYGATEASGIVEYRIESATPLPAGRIPAGFPLGDVEIVIRDEQGRSVAVGDAGEVTIRSRFLSSGYWRRPELTRAVFESDPHDEQMRTYCTGDIGRLRPDGCLELVGRRDEQVKVRGYRVHPGEIELALVEHPGIREAIITSDVEADGRTRLVAYVVPQSRPAPTAALLRRYLAARLPAYMVPSAYVAVGALPLLANGKVDRRALPPPPGPEPVGEHHFVAPRSPTEHQMAAIWERIFGASPIGVNDNFFDLGGDSLRAATLVSAIEDTFGRVLAPSVLLKAPTVGELTAATILVERGFKEPLTALRASGTRAPIFFLHNDYGRGLYTHALARALPGDHPFYAVHRDGVDEKGAAATIEGLAANCVRALRVARPRGPYVLGGHCHGGLIALEMAHQLRGAGEDVELVVMVDTRAPSATLRAFHRATTALGPLGGPVFHGVHEGFKLLAFVCGEIGWRTRYYLNRVRRAVGNGAGAPVARRRLSESTAAPLIPIELRRAYSNAVRRYAPPSYAGRVALFRAEELPARSPDLGWSPVLQRLEIVVVPGDHYTCITRHVAAFGARLDSVLRNPPTEWKASAERSRGDVS
jgi:amino acid adenylation domain-containing protein